MDDATPIKVRVRVRVPADSRAPGSARRALTELRPALGDRMIEPATLLISELVTNSVRHAALTGDDVIDVHIEATPQQLRVEVADPGPGFERDDGSRDERSEGGFGMILLGELASRWGVDPAAPTRVWFQIDRTPWPGHENRSVGLVGGRAG